MILFFNEIIKNSFNSLLLDISGLSVLIFHISGAFLFNQIIIMCFFLLLFDVGLLLLMLDVDSLLLLLFLLISFF